MKNTAVMVLLIMNGCAANSGVTAMGTDTFFVSRQAATGFSGAGTLKAEALQEANQHCISMRRAMEVISVSEAQPPYIFGNFPKAEVQFKCVNK